MHLIHDLFTAMQTEKSLLTPVAELSSQAFVLFMTKDVLSKKGWVGVSNCSLCNHTSLTESRDHWFL